MTNEHRVFTLSDHAIVLYFALKEFGPLTAAQMCEQLRKSPASIYRSMRELRLAGYLPASPWDNVARKVAPKAVSAKTYALQSDFTHAA